MKRFKPIIGRSVFVILFFAFQLGLILLMLWRFNSYFAYFYALSVLIGIVFVIKIVNDDSNPGYKIAWIIPIAFVPVFGVLLYVIFGSDTLSKRTVRKMDGISRRAMTNFGGVDRTAAEALRKTDVSAANQSDYISKYAMCPLYLHTHTEYLHSGEEKFKLMLEELEKAEKFIFLEYFIIGEGIMWEAVLNILRRKVTEGVDVRVIYDDFGCLDILPFNYDKKLCSMGIKCAVFNPFVPFLDVRLNNRDHRKICVIDGKVGFNGGINLADEYINAYEKHGHWKDSAVMLKGDAVWSLTVMFLTMWDYITKGETDILLYKNNEPSEYEDCGFVQPYTDNPLDGEPVGETVYMNIISKATEYLYITTPYLIISSEMLSALCTASKSGVDIRIITPHIADKPYVHSVTRAYYEKLTECGVKIYEYTPGFIHAKNYVADDKYGIVGTINMDYRSLYLHFECATWMYGTKSVAQIKDDFLHTLEECEQITLERCRNVKWYIKITRAILRLFAPLM